MTTKFITIALALVSLLPTHATYFPSFDATICAHANGSVTLEGEICPPY